MITLIELVEKAAWIVTVLIIIRAVLTWIPSVDYGHPLIRWITRLTDPIMVPVRRLLPPVGGLDLSPLIAILLVQIAGYFLVRILVAVFSGG